MTEHSEPQQAAAPASEPASSQPTESPAVDDLASLLAEYDREISKPSASPQPAQQSGPEPANGHQDDLSALLSDLAHEPAAVNDALARAHNALLEAQKNGFATDLLKGRLDTLSNHLGAIQQHQAQLQDQNDFSQVVSDADRMLREAGAVVGDDFAKRWLIAESKLNPALTAAFDNRYASKDHLRQANRQVKKSMDKLLKAAKAMPDRQATEDRMAIAAAVRGTSTKIPEKGPVRYGDVNDAEFAKEKAKFGL